MNNRAVTESYLHSQEDEQKANLAALKRVLDKPLKRKKEGHCTIL